MANAKKTKKAEPFFDARGRLLIERRGLPRSLGATLSKDLYHFLRSASWTRILLLFAGMFLAANFVFATILTLGHASVTTATGFWDHFWFSVQTMATIGYGVLSPADTLSNVIVTIESFIGIGMTALITGVFFSRFAIAGAKVHFSNVAIVHQYDGKRTLMFRMANARSTAIVEANVRVYASRDEKTLEGEAVRRVYDLPLRRNNSPIFALSWVVYHVLDETSPLFEMTPDTLRAGNLNIIVTFHGTDERLAETIYTRYSYNPEDIMFERKFADIIKFDPETKVRYLDFEQFHVTEPYVPPSLPSAGTEPRPTS